MSSCKLSPARIWIKNKIDWSIFFIVTQFTLYTITNQLFKLSFVFDSLNYHNSLWQTNGIYSPIMLLNLEKWFTRPIYQSNLIWCLCLLLFLLLVQYSKTNIRVFVCVKVPVTIIDKIKIYDCSFTNGGGRNFFFVSKSKLIYCFLVTSKKKEKQRKLS